MADELKVPLPLQHTGLTLLGKVFSASAQIGSDTAMTEIGTTAIYAASFSLTGVADGEYMVRFDTATKTYATGKLYVLNQAQVTPEQYALATNLATVDAVVDAIKAVTDLLPNAGALTDIDTGVNNLETRVPDTISLANINAEVDTALTDYDGPTKAELDTAQAAIIAEVDANEAKIDIIDSNLDTVKADLDDGGRLDLLIDGVKAKTDNLPANTSTDLNTINVGVQKASKFIPHGTDL